MHHLVRLVLFAFLTLGSARAEAPLLSNEDGATELATLVDVPWQDFEEAKGADFPALIEHWQRVGAAFTEYSARMAQGEDVLKEWSVVAPRMLKIGMLLGRSGDALLDTLPEDDPSLPVRKEGLGQIRTGIERMSQGCLMVLVEMPADVRGPFVRDFGEVLPAIIEQLDPTSAVMLKAQARGAATLLPDAEAAQLAGGVGEIGENPPEPGLAEGAPDRLLVALTAAGWPGAMQNGWSKQVLDVDWTAHPANPQTQKADAYALLLAAHGWFSALGEGRTTSLDEPGALLDGALRAGVGALAAEDAIADVPLLRTSLSELTLRATAAAAHYPPKERGPLVEALEARLPGLLGALPEEEAAELHAALSGVADKKLAKQLGL
ncbi:MAG: hypothetical protein KC912_18820 [Proteobacteria bacterium]|nr:hypothetical protein [Pseudomonadota bacterium]